MTMSTDDRLRQAAKLRVDARISFRIHLFVYLVVNGGLVLLNLVTSPGYLWCLWVAAGWGVGLVAHGYAVYGVAQVDRERMIQEELARMRGGAPPK